MRDLTKPFGYRGEAETCLWCGERLRKPRGFVLEPEGRGDYGDGHFCTLRCGYEFGRRLADLGRRLVASSSRSEP